MALTFGRRESTGDAPRAYGYSAPPPGASTAPRPTRRTTMVAGWTTAALLVPLALVTGGIALGSDRPKGGAQPAKVEMTPSSKLDLTTAPEQAAQVPVITPGASPEVSSGPPASAVQPAAAPKALPTKEPKMTLPPLTAAERRLAVDAPTCGALHQHANDMRVRMAEAHTRAERLRAESSRAGWSQERSAALFTAQMDHKRSEAQVTAAQRAWQDREC